MGEYHTNINYELLFGLPNKEYDNLMKSFYAASHRHDLAMLKRIFEDAKEMYFSEDDIVSLIEQLVKQEMPTNRCELLLDKLSNCNLVKKIYFQDQSTILDTDYGQIKFAKISELFPEIIVEAMPEKDKQEGECHSLSMDVCLQLFSPNEIVTGYISTISDKARFLHSWIETTINGNELVIDPTASMVINKTGYYFLYHAEPLSRVRQSHLIYDIYRISCLGLSNKEVLLYWNEIIRNLEQNQQLFIR